MLEAETYGRGASKVQQDERARHKTLLADALEPFITAAPAKAVHRLRHAKSTGAWLSAAPHQLNGTVLSIEEFRDNLRLRFGFPPLHMPGRCGGCGAKFTVDHAMCCQKGGLIVRRHNDLAGEWHTLCVSAKSAGAVADEPLTL